MMLCTNVEENRSDEISGWDLTFPNPVCMPVIYYTSECLPIRQQDKHGRQTGAYLQVISHVIKCKYQ